MMKNNLNQHSKIKRIIPIIITFLFTNILLAQFSSDNFAFNDENTSLSTESYDFTSAPTTIQKEKTKRSSFKIFGGASFNNFNTSDNLESNVRTGFMLGASYKRGKFFYYEIGARYNYRGFELKGYSDTAATTFGVSAIDVPITGGINLTSYVDKLIGVRIFISAVPSFVIGVENDNSAGFDKDDLNSFVMCGQAGVGIDIAFFFIEAGYNYGFTDTMKDYSSNLSQAFVGIGFRF